MKTRNNLHYIKIKLNCDLLGFMKGSIIPLIVGRNDFWNRRLDDSKIDNCVERVSDCHDIIIIPLRGYACLYSYARYWFKVIKNNDEYELSKFFQSINEIEEN